MKNILLYASFISISLSITSCPFSFGDGGAWKERFGTPELLLENARDESYVYLYTDESPFQDNGNIIKEAIKSIAPFEENDSKTVPKDTQYFTYQAEWVPATTGPNYVHLSIWKNGFVRIDHKSSLGPHEYLYFSVDEEKASTLVDLVFSMCEQE